MRRNTQSVEQPEPKPYTVSRHFDKTLNRADTALTARGRHLRRGLSFTSDVEPTLSSATPSGLRVPESEGWSMSRQMEQSRQPMNNMSNTLGGMSLDTRRQSGLRRLRTIDSGLASNLPPDFSSQEQHSLLSSVPERGVHGFSQPLPGSDTFLFSSSPTLLGRPGRGELALEELLLVSQIQHQGLCEASKIWADFMDMVGEELAPVETMEDFLGVLSKFEDEFGRHWDDIVVATTQRMGEVYGGSH
ncbi:hypothetical protein B0J18DRAFT_271825 [Chaetomium sp. MPI-SDFR-AT-0129]|nr:hypothetical protein B0J18DRAFT_271825 [Chaetomium sp. MPI-SDFR-AT-0129]